VLEILVQFLQLDVTLGKLVGSQLDLALELPALSGLPLEPLALSVHVRAHQSECENRVEHIGPDGSPRRRHDLDSHVDVLGAPEPVIVRCLDAEGVVAGR